MPRRKLEPLDLMRAEVCRKPWSVVRRWRTRDLQWAIEESHITYGEGSNDAIRDRYRVMKKSGSNWSIASTHTKKSAAMKMLQQLIAKEAGYAAR